MNISDILLSGSENALLSRDLQALTGLSGRAIRARVQRERRRGAPICSGESGYYVAESERELQSFLRSYRGRGLSTLSTSAMMAEARRDSRR